MKPLRHQKRSSWRLAGHDYSSSGFYFITVGTRKMAHYFGHIDHHGMNFNKLGIIAYDRFQKIPYYFERVKIHSFVIMPNHIHGLIEIIERQPGKIDQRKHEMGVIIANYKASVTRWANKSGYEYFRWKHRYYDSILRKYDAYERVTYYIENNIAAWQRKYMPLVA